MRVGIITFHWATNYGAILQAYALQQAIKALGHDVKIINYKPSQYDDGLWQFFRFRKFMNLKKYRMNRSKERRLTDFRSEHLITTPRFNTLKELQGSDLDFDVLITGSDQVLNESFLEHGEFGGSTAYFLDFGKSNAVRAAYAASFGSTQYPLALCQKVSPLIAKFQYVSARESSGLEIFAAMGGKDVKVVPDPTLLHDADFYDGLLTHAPKLEKRARTYMLHDRRIANTDAEVITDESIAEWINAIRSSSSFVTNSFHGTVFCLLYNVPFTVVLPTAENFGMNDRFYTLLEPLGLTNRIVSEADFNINGCAPFTYNWAEINDQRAELRDVGLNFLKQIFNQK